MSAADKTDLVKDLKQEYTARKTPALVTVSAGKYLTFDGEGTPGGEAFAPAYEALYSMVYTIKFARKAAGKDFKACPPEGLYWLAHGKTDYCTAAPADWRWKLMIRVPSFIRDADLAKARKVLAEKGKPGQLGKVKLEKLAEGRCVQMLHVGPYNQVAAAYGKMIDFAAAQGLAFHGRPHEIYFSDPRRVPPEKYRTIVRNPVRPIGKG